MGTHPSAEQIALMKINRHLKSTLELMNACEKGEDFAVDSIYDLLKSADRTLNKLIAFHRTEVEITQKFWFVFEDLRRETLANSETLSD